MSESYHEGYQDRLNWEKYGGPRPENPYMRNSPDWLEYEKGWNDWDDGSNGEYEYDE